MLAFFAALFFAISVILQWIGGHSTKYWITFALLAATCMALHWAFGDWRPWAGRTGPRP